MVAARSGGSALIDPRDVLMRLRAEHFAAELSDAELTGLVAAAAAEAGVTLRCRSKVSSAADAA
jgi:hypothetical protein